MALPNPSPAPKALLDTLAAIWGFDMTSKKKEEDDVKSEQQTWTWDTRKSTSADHVKQELSPPAISLPFEGIEDISDSESIPEPDHPSPTAAALTEDHDNDYPEPPFLDEESNVKNHYSEPPILYGEAHGNSTEDESTEAIPGPFVVENNQDSEMQYAVSLHETIKLNKRKAAVAAEEYIGRRRSRPSSPQPQPQKRRKRIKRKTTDEDGVYEVSRIISVYTEPARRQTNDAGESEMIPAKKWYLVEWEGYDQSHDTWEPEENFVNAEQKVAEFWERKRKAKHQLIAAVMAALFTGKLKRRLKKWRTDDEGQRQQS